MSSGAKQVTRYGVETTVGQQAQAWQTLAFTANSLDATAQTTESTTIKDTRVASGTLVTGVEVAGDIETEFVFGAQDELLTCVAFNDWVDGVLTFGGTKRKTLSVVRGFADVNNFQVFTGCHVNQWALSISDGGIVSSKFSLMGMGRKAYDTEPDGDVTKAPDATQFTSLDTGDVLLNGTTQAGMCVTQLDLTIENGMQVQKCLGKKDSNGIGAILETIMKGSGSLTIAWSENTAKLYEKQFVNEPISISYPLTDSKGNQYIINLPKVLLSAPLPSGSASDVLTTQFSFTVADVAPTITRKFA